MLPVGRSQFYLDCPVAREWRQGRLPPMVGKRVCVGWVYCASRLEAGGHMGPGRRLILHGGCISFGSFCPSLTSMSGRRQEEPCRSWRWWPRGRRRTRLCEGTRGLFLFTFDGRVSLFPLVFIDLGFFDASCPATRLHHIATFLSWPKRSPPASPALETLGFYAPVLICGWRIAPPFAFAVAG